MKRLAVVRHGETDWNSQGLIQGRIDIPLNDNGIQQARALANELAAHPFDHIVTSDLQRAHQTATAIHTSLCEPPHLNIEPRLRELHMGALQGTRVTDPSMIAEIFDGNHTPQGGEPVEEVDARLRELFLDLTAHPAKQVLLVTHGGIVRALYRLAGHPIPHIYNCTAHWFYLDSDGTLSPSTP